MSYAMSKLLYALANDSAVLRSFHADPVETATSFGIDSDDQLDAILRRDVGALADMNIHPLLLMGYAMSSGMSVVDLQDQLSWRAGHPS